MGFAQVTNNQVFSPDYFPRCMEFQGLARTFAA